MQAMDGLIYGLGVATQPLVLGYCLIGVLLGTFTGVLPGVGALAAISLLLPITYYIPPEAALVMLAGVYYGAQYGGSVASILLRLPGTAQAAVTATDGYPLAQQGKAGLAFIGAMGGSFIGSMVGIVLLVLFAPAISRMGTAFGPADYFSMMILGLVAASTIGSGSTVKAMSMVVLGMILGCVGTDVNSGVVRLAAGQSELYDGINIVALAMGLFGLSEVINNIRLPEGRVTRAPTMRDMFSDRAEIRRILPAALRGSSIGSFFGALPGTGGVIATFIAYALERKVSRRPHMFGKGAVEGVAAPESANNSASITAFIPTLTLGIPGDVVMALMLGAMIVHGIQPGPMMIVERPEMFWGLIVSFGFGNLMLLVLNIPMVGLWVSLLRIPFPYLYPIIIVFVCLGTYSVKNSLFDICSVAVIGGIGYLFSLMRFNPAMLLLGVVLGPLIEVNLRRTLLIARGDALAFLQSPVSAVFLAMAVVLVLSSAYGAIRGQRTTKTEDRPSEGAAE